MFLVSALAGRLSPGRLLALWATIVGSLGLLGTERSAMAEPPSAPRDFSGWRGGIGITFGTPSRDIADVTEMGYEIAWGGEDPRAIKSLGVSVFRYWNSIVETSLKGAGYDFSQMPDKDEAARRAFNRAVEPQDYWANFYQGVCAYRQRDFDAASAALRVWPSSRSRRRAFTTAGWCTWRRVSGQPPCATSSGRSS